MNTGRLIHRLHRFLIHRFTAKNEHGVHSAFVYDLLTNVIRERGRPETDQTIESVRQKMLGSRAKINLTDYGAGGTLGGMGRGQTIGDICKRSACPPAKGRLLGRIVRKCRARKILELGTNLGIGSLYLSRGDHETEVFTIEGSPELARLAKSNFEAVSSLNINQFIGEFSRVLPKVLEEMEEVDLAYLDGNHRKEPTLAYFEAIYPFCHENSFIILDDIHWSAEMSDAWDSLCNDPRISVSIDLYHIGLLFFRKGIEKQHFRLR